MKRIAKPFSIDVRQCTFMCAQRAAHRLVQIYDHAFQRVGLTSVQFGLLAYLYQTKSKGPGGASLSAIAEFAWLHGRALHRELRGLKALGLVAYTVDPADRRVRVVLITDKGCAKLRKAVPFWHHAQGRVREALGAEVAAELNDMLDLTLTKLET